MKVLFDTNVILDAVLARVPFVENAAYLLDAVELGKIQGFISATTVTDIHSWGNPTSSGFGVV